MEYRTIRLFFEEIFNLAPAAYAPFWVIIYSLTALLFTLVLLLSSFLVMTPEDAQRTQKPYRYGMILLCFGALINWIGLAENYTDPFRYAGVACIIGGAFLICTAMCCWLHIPNRSAVGVTEVIGKKEKKRCSCISLRTDLGSRYPYRRIIRQMRVRTCNVQKSCSNQKPKHETYLYSSVNFSIRSIVKQHRKIVYR